MVTISQGPAPRFTASQRGWVLENLGRVLCAPVVLDQTYPYAPVDNPTPVLDDL